MSVFDEESLVVNVSVKDRDRVRLGVLLGVSVNVAVDVCDSEDESVTEREVVSEGDIEIVWDAE